LLVQPAVADSLEQRALAAALVAVGLFEHPVSPEKQVRGFVRIQEMRLRAGLVLRQPERLLLLV
jgi:hypothetical protein